MNKKRIALISSAVILTMIFSSCSPFSSIDTITPPVTTEEAPVQLPEPTKEVTPPTEAPTVTEAPTASETTTAEVILSSGETLLGYTTKGYRITQKNGLTYVDGILIANKTYALPSDYNPGQLLSECSAAFSRMQSDAASQGLNIWNASGFRSYSLQSSLYSRYSERDGKAAADRYSARPGHSEHQTGLAIDLNEISSSFANTAEGKWIAENCWRYGFILRYLQEKESKTGYMYEPWHIRYVGVEAAEKIYKSGLCLEEYYGITSEYGAPLIPEGAAVPEVSTTAETTTILIVG